MLNSAAEAFSGFVHRHRASTSSALEGLGSSLSRSLSKLAGAAKDPQTLDNPPTETTEKDALTQEEIPDIFFVLERENNVIARVDAARLIDYLLATGDYTDPETRVSLSEETLQRLDVFGKRLGRPSVIDARVTRAREYKDEGVKRDIIASLESVVGECIAQMYDTIERVNDGEVSIDDATVQLFTDTAPLLEESFKQLVLVDVESARLKASAMESFLRGPPQRPTRDRYNFLPTVLHIFHTACGQT